MKRKSCVYSAGQGQTTHQALRETAQATAERLERYEDVLNMLLGNTAPETLDLLKDELERGHSSGIDLGNWILLPFGRAFSTPPTRRDSVLPAIGGSEAKSGSSPMSSLDPAQDDSDPVSWQTQSPSTPWSFLLDYDTRHFLDPWDPILKHSDATSLIKTEDEASIIQDSPQNYHTAPRFGSCPSLEARQMLNTQYQRALDSQGPDHALLPLHAPDDSLMTKMYIGFREAARVLIQRGTPAPCVLGDLQSVDVRLFFRDRRLDDPSTVDNWACELLKGFRGALQLSFLLAWVSSLTRFMRVSFFKPGSNF